MRPSWHGSTPPGLSASVRIGPDRTEQYPVDAVAVEPVRGGCGAEDSRPGEGTGMSQYAYSPECCGPGTSVPRPTFMKPSWTATTAPAYLQMNMRSGSRRMMPRGGTSDRWQIHSGSPAQPARRTTHLARSQRASSSDWLRSRGPRRDPGRQRQASLPADRRRHGGYQLDHPRD